MVGSSRQSSAPVDGSMLPDAVVGSDRECAAAGSSAHQPYVVAVGPAAVVAPPVPVVLKVPVVVAAA